MADILQQFPIKAKQREVFRAVSTPPVSTAGGQSAHPENAHTERNTNCGLAQSMIGAQWCRDAFLIASLNWKSSARRRIGWERASVSSSMRMMVSLRYTSII